MHFPQRRRPLQRCVVGDRLDAHVWVRCRKLGSDLAHHLEKRGRMCAAGIPQGIIGWAAGLSTNDPFCQYTCAFCPEIVLANTSRFK
jgi:hypothetical protein